MEGSSLYYYKPKTLLSEYLATNCHVRQAQLYNPLFALFFDLNATNYNSIALNHRYHMTSLGEVTDMHTQKTVKKDIFIKYSPLLDPLEYMIGKYNIQDPKILTMPGYEYGEDQCHPKLLSTSNASYVDCFFYYLSSQLLHNQGFVHGCDFYGSFLGIQDHFRMNVEEDLEYLSGSSFFMNNIGKMITLENYEHHPFIFYGSGSKQNKMRLNVEESVEIELDSLSLDMIHEKCEKKGDESLHANDSELRPTSVNIPNDCPTSFVSFLPPSATGNIPDVIYERETELQSDSGSNSGSSSGSSSGSDSDSDSSVSQSEDYTVPEDDESVSDIESNTEEESDSSAPETTCLIDNFPVQMICLEKCQGTLDELFDQDKVDAERGIAYMFQVIMTLLVYQRTYGFTHNDLHTNNIMYVRTDQPFLWYKVDDQLYKVPTYGYIFKLIDFGRSIYHFQGRCFCSDSFAPGGDGSNQYNCEPYFNSNQPRIEPNYSFDLCRLGCSIYDFVISDQYDKTTFDPLQQLIFDWCTDDDGKNILYKGKNGRERYPGFKLYKMIARKVHAHTPELQLKRDCFQTFLVQEVETHANVMNIRGTV